MWKSPKHEEKKELENDTKGFSLNHWRDKIATLRDEGLEKKQGEVVYIKNATRAGFMDIWPVHLRRYRAQELTSKCIWKTTTQRLSNGQLRKKARAGGKMEKVKRTHYYNYLIIIRSPATRVIGLCLGRLNKRFSSCPNSELVLHTDRQLSVQVIVVNCLY